ncbi:hypothetical protein Tco_0060454 [Tanacetum coccineum]
MQTPGKGTRIVEKGPMSLEKIWGRENVEEAFTISHELPDQYVTIGTTLTTNCKQLLADVLWENREVQVDYSSLNKASAKDMYPLPEEGEGLASLMGYPYKCFLRLPKEYNQIRMAEDDEEKTESHTEEGVYCFTHMPKELKKLHCCTSEDDGKGLSRSKRKEGGNILERNSNKKQKKGRNPDTCFLCKPTATGMEICYIPTEKRVQALIYTARSLRSIFRKHKVKVVTDRPMEETLKLVGREGRLGKWATEIRTYDISYIQRKEAEGLIVKKFFGQGEQVEETPDANKGGILDLSKGFQANSAPTTRAWRLYLGRETIKEGSGVGIILISPKEKMYLYAIRLKFKEYNHAMDCEALLAV